MAEVLRRIRDRPRINPVIFGLPDSTLSMTVRDLIVEEMATVPEPILAEVLDFLRFLKVTRLQSSRFVTIVSPEGESQVSLNVLQQDLSEMGLQSQLAKQSIEQLRQDLNRSLYNCGYTTKDSIIELVRDVKKEMMAEQESRINLKQ